MRILKDLLDQPLSGVDNANDLLGEQGLMRELKARLMERMLGAELTEHHITSEFSDVAVSRA